MTSAPRLTDDAVAELPVSRGRADLLEEIMAVPARGALSETVGHRFRGRPGAAWLAPAGAAALVAVVAVLATAPSWTGGTGPRAVGDRAPAAGSTPSAVVSSAPPSRVVLDAPGWRLDHFDTDGLAGIQYSRGDRRLEITAAPAHLYDGYVEDREHISDPAAPGVPVEVLGQAGQMWAYGAEDHTVIRTVERGSWLELRGSGMDRAAFLRLLEQLRQVDEAEFEAALPARFITSTESLGQSGRMLDGIAAAIGPDRGLMPPGQPAPRLSVRSTDHYQLGAQVAGAVACGWLQSYERARAAGDDAARTDAVAALATSHRWPVLNQMVEEGDYSEVLWDYAADAAAGRDVSGYPGGLGCG